MRRSRRMSVNGVRVRTPRARSGSCSARRRRGGKTPTPTSPTKEARMSDQQAYQKLSREELEQLAGEELPERAAMSLVNANIAIPINAAIAANVLSDGAIAYAEATQ